MTFAQLEPVIGLRGKDGAGIGDDRIRLLEAVDAHGSISAASRHVGLTYKAAWDAISAINNLAERPLVIGRIGGRAGGGAVLTDDGRRFSARYSSCSTSCVVLLADSVRSSARKSSYQLFHGDT